MTMVVCLPVIRGRGIPLSPEEITAASCSPTLPWANPEVAPICVLLIAHEEKASVVSTDPPLPPARPASLRCLFVWVCSLACFRRDFACGKLRGIKLVTRVPELSCCSPSGTGEGVKGCLPLLGGQGKGGFPAILSKLPVGAPRRAGPASSPGLFSGMLPFKGSHHTHPSGEELRLTFGVQGPC